ncbi:MAG: type IV pilin N-terminal domain-containing protein [Methanoregula sp.]
MILGGLNNDGVSSTIGSIFLITIVVAGMAILMVAVVSQPHPQKVPAMTADIIRTENELYLKHEGGDTLQRGEFQILVDGQDKTTAFGNPATWSVGQVLEYSGYDSNNIPRTIQIVYTGDGSGTTIVQLWV